MPKDSLTGNLAAPGTVLQDAGMRVQENIHGHRFVQEQEPYMVVLETLAVCASHPLGTVPRAPGTHEDFSYRLPHREKLRFLLFQDRHLERVVRDASIHDHEKWQVWKDRLNAQFRPNEDPQDHFAHLDQAFGRKIDALLQAVRLLRSMEIDVMHNRRWTSRFLAVTGPELLLTDMRESGGRWSSDRRFFGRAGELVYLMLNRSERAAQLGAQIQSRMLDAQDPMNLIAAKLAGPDTGGASNAQIGYLPLESHPAYDRMARDWEKILRRDLPNGHLFEPLFRMTGLNLLVYLAERAQDLCGAPAREPIVMDMGNGQDKQLRELSKVHLNRHRHAANRAVRAYIEARTDGDTAWQTAVAHEDASAARQALKRLFNVKALEVSQAAPLKQREALIEDACKRDKNNIHAYLLPLGKGVGLIETRPRVGSWFAMNDAMLFALVMARVEGPVELRHFVRELYESYGIVIGPEEARRAFDRPEVGIQSFEANLAALEQRMTHLALTRRLSDDCAFVTNPYGMSR